MEFVKFYMEFQDSERNFSQKFEVMSEIDEDELLNETRYTDVRSTVDSEEDIGKASPKPMEMARKVQRTDVELTKVNDENSSHNRDWPVSRNVEVFKTPRTMERIKMSTLISTNNSIQRRSVYTRKCRSNAGLSEDSMSPDSQKVESLSGKMEKHTNSVRRVRFSDSFDDEAFYEARDTLDEVPITETKSEDKFENAREESVAESTNTASPLEDLKPLISSSLKRLNLDESSIHNKENSNNNGILSSVVKAVRHAFKNLAGDKSPKCLKTQQTVLSTHISTNSTPIVSSLSNKRSRDIETQEVAACSPIVKRLRAWPKIRGRPPISRMRHETLTTSREISSNTQGINQGYLKADDTVSPIPSVAHKSTQTK
ncbi:uncharacterized protein [Prorops nasuta]|uniref:uncharacterized protein isoform X2 n=1 Tax=Prorops nasuta TaxID=863751 RepID=UPI0034CE6FD7